MLGKMLLLLTSEMMWGKMLLLLLTISVPTTQNEVKPTKIQSHEGYSYSQGTSNAATQPELFSPVCQTIRLVFSLSPHQLGSSKIHGEPDKTHSYTFKLDSFIQHPNHLTNVIIFGTFYIQLLHL
jgi:hypothetical protein